MSPTEPRPPRPWRATSRLGRWAEWAAFAFVLGFVVNQALVVLRNGYLDIPAWVGMAWGFGWLAVGFAGSCAAVAAIVGKDPAVTVRLALLPGAFALLLLAGELLLPH